MTGEHKEDQELETYLQGKDGLTQDYHKVSNESPPEHIDAAIIAASRKAAGSKPMKVVAPFSSRWHIPVSIAAVVVLSVLLVFNIPDDTILIPSDPRFEIENRALSDSIDGNESARTIPTESAVQMNEGRMLESESDQSPALQQGAAQIREQSFGLAPEPPVDEQSVDMPAVSPQLSPASLTVSEAIEDDDAIMRRGIMREEAATEASGSADTMEILTTQERAIDAVAGNVALKLADSPVVECTLPRPEFCTEEYIPVCAVRDTGIRCVTTPCDSTERVEYSNACAACRVADVISYTAGRCE